MGEAQNDVLKLHFDDHRRLEFKGAKVTTHAGLLAVRELDAALGLTADVDDTLLDGRTGRNTRHDLAGLLRQSVCARLAGPSAATVYKERGSEAGNFTESRAEVEGRAPIQCYNRCVERRIRGDVSSES